MQYLDIRYTVRTRIERNEWYVAIYPDGVELRGKVVVGSREDAEFQAHSMISDWLHMQAHKPLAGE